MNHADEAARYLTALREPHSDYNLEDIRTACAMAQVHALLAIAEGLDRLKRPTGRGPG